MSGHFVLGVIVGDGHGAASGGTVPEPHAQHVRIDRKVDLRQVQRTACGNAVVRVSPRSGGQRLDDLLAVMPQEIRRILEGGAGRGYVSPARKIQLSPAKPIALFSLYPALISLKCLSAWGQAGFEICSIRRRKTPLASSSWMKLTLLGATEAPALAAVMTKESKR